MWEIYGVGLIHGGLLIVALERVVFPLVVAWSQRRRTRRQIVLPD